MLQAPRRSVARRGRSPPGVKSSQRHSRRSRKEEGHIRDDMRMCMYDRGNHVPHNVVLTRRIDASAFDRPTRPLINKYPPSRVKRFSDSILHSRLRPPDRPAEQTTVLIPLNRAELLRDETVRACAREKDKRILRCLAAEYIGEF